MNLPKIGIDIDGTIRDLYTPLREEFIKRVSIDVDPIKKWHNHKIWNHFRQNGKTVSTSWFKHFWFKATAPTVYYYNAKLYDSVQEGLALLRKAGFSINFVSAQPNELTKKLTIQFLNKFNVKYDSLIFTMEKWNWGFDVILEDSPEQMRMIRDCKHYTLIYKMNRPWNNQSKFDIPYDCAVNDMIDFAKRMIKVYR